MQIASWDAVMWTVGTVPSLKQMHDGYFNSDDKE